MKDNRSTAFFKVLKDNLKLGHSEAILLAYIAEFEAQGLPCFASRSRIAEDLHLGQSTIQRIIKTLIKSGHVTISRNGWKRVLQTANLVQNEPTRGVKMNQVPGSKRTTHLVQNEPIQRYITNNNNKETIQSAREDISLEIKSNNGYTMEWDAEKKAMVRRKAN